AAGLEPVGGALRAGAPGLPLADSLAVRLRAGDGTPLAGVVVIWVAAEGGGAVSPLTSTTGPDGVARTAWTLGPGAGAQRAEAFAAGEQAGFVANGAAPARDESPAPPGPPAAFRRVSGAGQSGTAGETLADSLVAQVVDAAGVPVPGVAVSWGSLAAGAVVSPAAGTTDAQGITRASVQLGPGAGTQRARVTAPGLTPVAFDATALPGAAAVVEAGPEGAVLESLGDSVVLAATVHDGFGNPIPGAPVEWTSLDPDVASASGAGTVVAVGNGTARIEARSDAAADTVMVEVAQQAVAFRRTGGDLQADTVGRTLADSLAVQVVDARGHGVPGVPVAWAAMTGGGSVSPAATVSDAQGHARTGWTLGPVPGAQSARATSAGLTPVGFGATALAAPVAAVVVSPDSSLLAALGQTLQLSASATDAGGTPVAPSFAWTSLDPTVVSVSATGVVTALANGVARVEARANGAADTARVVVAQQAVALHRVAGHLQADTVGRTLADSLAVQVVDARGHGVAGVAVGWQPLSGGGSVSPAATVSDAQGHARAAWTLGVAVGTQTARATSAGLTPAGFSATAHASQVAAIALSPDSSLLAALGATVQLSAATTRENGDPVMSPVDWTSLDPAVASVSAAGVVTALANGTARIEGRVAGVADTARVVVAQQPAAFQRAAGDLQADTVGRTLADSLAVRVLDARGHPVAGAAVTWTAMTGGGAVSPAAAVSDAEGYARTAWTLGPVPGAQSARVTAPGVTPVGFGATALAAPAAAVVASPDSSLLAALGQTVQLSATATDAGGTPVAPPFTWTSLDSAVVAVSATGVATALANGTGRVEARAGDAADTVVVVVAQQAASLHRMAGHLQTDTVGRTLADSLVVQVVDARGSGVAGVAVAWQPLSGGGAVSPDTGHTDAQGFARTAWTLGTAAGAQTARATSAGLTPAGFNATALAGPGAAVVVDRDSALLVSLGDTVRLGAAASDSFGNPVSAFTWTALDSALVTVDSAGLVTAVAEGTAGIEARAGAAADTAWIVVRQEAASVALTGDTVIVGDTATLAVDARDANGHAVPRTSLAWTSLDPGLLAVDSAGRVTGVARGTARVAAAGPAVADTVEVVVFAPVTVTVDGVPVTTPGLLAPGADVRVENEIFRLRRGQAVDSVSIFAEALGDTGWIAATDTWYGDWTYVGSTPVTAPTAVELIAVSPGEVAVRWTFGSHSMPPAFGNPGYAYAFTKTVWLRAGETGYYAQLVSLSPTPSGVGDREHEIGFGGLFGPATLRTGEATIRTDTLTESRRLNRPWNVDAAELDRDGDPLLRVLVPLPGGEMITPRFSTTFFGSTYLHLLGNSLTYGAYLYAAPREGAAQARDLCARAWREAPFSLAAPTEAQLATCGPEPR
ncbi:MAG TPA: Ig-like domain-containing protein, partial [Longimicrobiaceae bacterium]|nr:Ig-like domain-containing protein [Longimicrobiaceae bacterium]